jgi:hypothetical protein
MPKTTAFFYRKIEDLLKNIQTPSDAATTSRLVELRKLLRQLPRAAIQANDYHSDRIRTSSAAKKIPEDMYWNPTTMPSFTLYGEWSRPSVSLFGHNVTYGVMSDEVAGVDNGLERKWLPLSEFPKSDWMTEATLKALLISSGNAASETIYPGKVAPRGDEEFVHTCRLRVGGTVQVTVIAKGEKDEDGGN